MILITDYCYYRTTVTTTVGSNTAREAGLLPADPGGTPLYLFCCLLGPLLLGPAHVGVAVVNGVRVQAGIPGKQVGGGRQACGGGGRGANRTVLGDVAGRCPGWPSPPPLASLLTTSS